MSILKAIATLSALVVISSCSTTRPVSITTTQIKPKIERKGLPRALSLQDPKFYVVTDKNFEEFKAKFLKDHSSFTLFVLDESGYKKLVRNQSEFKRYIAQLRSVVVYYEEVTQ